MQNAEMCIDSIYTMNMKHSFTAGIGQPKTKRFMYSVDGRPLEEVLDAVGSNRMDAQGRDVWLVLERIE